MAVRSSLRGEPASSSTHHLCWRFADCWVDLHLRNFLIYGATIDHLEPTELYRRYRLDKTEVRRVDGAPIGPHAPPYAVYPMRIKTPANTLKDPIIRITDFGTSFRVDEKPNRELHTPAPYPPPEAFFKDHITLAADIWTLGVSFYEVLGECCLFEAVGWDEGDIIAEIANSLGMLPKRWWKDWAARDEFFEKDGSGERLTAEQVLTSEYMVKWALPAWERQCVRHRDREITSA